MREQQNVWLDLKGYLQKFPDVCSSTRCEPGIDRCGVLFLYGRSLRRRKRQRPIRHYLERISSTVPQGNPGASEIEEGALSGEQMLMTDQQASELTKSCVGLLHDPAPLVTPRVAPIFVARSLVVLAVGRNPFHPSLLQSLPHSATSLPLPTAGADASRSKAKETTRARIATPRRFAESTECPRNKPGSMPTVGLGCPAVAWAGQHSPHQLSLLVRQQPLPSLHDRSTSANPPHP